VPGAASEIISTETIPESGRESERLIRYATQYLQMQSLIALTSYEVSKTFCVDSYKHWSMDRSGNPACVQQNDRWVLSEYQKAFFFGSIALEYNTAGIPLYQLKLIYVCLSSDSDSPSYYTMRPFWLVAGVCGAASLLGKRSRDGHEEEGNGPEIDLNQAGSANGRDEMIRQLAFNSAVDVELLIQLLAHVMTREQAITTYSDLMSFTVVPAQAFLELALSMDITQPAVALQRRGLLPGASIEEAFKIILAWKQICVDPMVTVKWEGGKEKPCVRNRDEWVMSDRSKSSFFYSLL
jgi:hypothetical protein